MSDSRMPQTIGEAHKLGFGIKVICHALSGGPKSSRHCLGKHELDMLTLLWKCGPNYPVERLRDGFLRCPRCGERYALDVVLIAPPPRVVSSRA